MRILARLTAIALIFTLIGVGLPDAQPARAAAERCFGLNADDCTLLKDADKGDALRKLSSFEFAYEAAVILASTQRDGTIDLSATGRGAVALDADAFGKLGRGDLNAALDRLSLAFNADGKLNIGSIEQAGASEFRIVNNTLYVKGEALTGNTWRSVDLRTITRRQGIRQAGVGGLLRGARALIALNRFNATAENFVTATRAADIDIEGQKIAVLQFNVDLNKLFAAKEFATLLKSALELSGEKVTDAEVAETVAMLGALGKNLSLTLMRYIGTVDRLPRGFGVALTGKLDPSVAQPLPGGGAPGGADIKPIDVNIRFDVKVSAIGKPVAIEAPADAQPLDLGKEE
jgi:hypothetical protein